MFVTTFSFGIFDAYPVSAATAPPLQENANGGLSVTNCLNCYDNATKGCGISDAELVTWDSFGQKCEGGNYSDTQKQSIKICASTALSTITTGQCGTIKSLFQNILLSQSNPTTDIEKCVQDLSNCSQLFQACQGDSGGLDINDLQGQCNYFLQGGSKKWADLKGANFCSQALNQAGPINTKCSAYKNKIIDAQKNLDLTEEQKNSELSEKKFRK
jgi:hypothetical protein